MTGSFRHFPLPEGIARHLMLQGEKVPAVFSEAAELPHTPERVAS